MTRRSLVALAAAAGLVVSLVALGGGAPTAGAAGSPDVASAPIRIAVTSDGSVGYRSVGPGSPILLITGFSASIDDWPPSFIDTLARSHRVVVFDNAGVGGTTAVAAPLTITAMAGQASALISTLKLGHTAVLGWSMGGMVAQAVAVLHPGQVSHLVLAATQAGTGQALPVPPAAQVAAASTNPAVVLGVLFPSDQPAAEKAYIDGILTYPGFYQAPDALKAAQTQAIDQWLAGDEAVGRRVHGLRVPTLVADGTDDQLDPVTNDRLLNHLIGGSHLVLYPGAGHAFLFQDAAKFLPRLESFLR